MPNAGSHAGAGAIGGLALVGLSSAVLGRTPGLIDVLSSTAATMVGSLLPDVIEPSVSPNHRGLFHSKLLVVVLVISSIKLLGAILERMTPRCSGTYPEDPCGLANRQDEITASRGESLLVLLVLALFVGVLIHLMMDGGTPKGLPMIG